MISSLQSRPQSRSYKPKAKIPKNLSRQVDRQQAEKCFKLGKEYYKQGNIQKTRQFYLQAIVHNPAYYQSYCNLGSIYRQQRLYPQAIDCYLTSLSFCPTDSNTNYNLANVYRIIGQQEQAIKLYKFVIQNHKRLGTKLDEVYIDCYINLGVCYKNIGNYNEAIDCFQNIRKIVQNNQTEQRDRVFKEIVFNEVVCYLRLLRNLGKKRQGCERLIEQKGNKTRQLLKQLQKGGIQENSNEIVELGLIQIEYLINPSSQILDKTIKAITDLLSSSSNKSSYFKDQCLRQKAYCLSLLQKSKKQALAKPQQSTASDSLKHSIQPKIPQKVTVNKYNFQMQQQKTIEKVEDKSSSKLPELKILSITSKNSVNSNQTINELQTKIPADFYEFLNKLISIISEEPQSFDFLPREIQKYSLNKRIQNQLYLIVYSVISERFGSHEYAETAYSLYVNYFLKGQRGTPAKKQIFKTIECHRAIASILTTLGQNEKAIQHYDIVSDEYKQSDRSDNFSKTIHQQLYSGLATNYSSQGLHLKAIVQFQKAIELDTTNYALYFNLASCQQQGRLWNDAIKSYEQFEKLVKFDNDLDQSAKNNLLLQCSINKYFCNFEKESLDGLSSSLVQQYKEIISSLNLVNDNPFQITALVQTIQSSLLMNFFLKSAQLFERVFQIQLLKSFSNIELSDNNSQSLIKQYKQELLSIYLNLLEFPEGCPDKDEILVNCGNILYEQKQFLSALTYYNRVDYDKLILIANNMGLTYLNLHQIEKSKIFLKLALDNSQDDDGLIYQINLEIIQWVNGTGYGDDSSAIYEKYPCKCEQQYSSRLEFGKSLTLKLTNQISTRLITEKLNHQNSNLFSKTQLNLNTLYQSLLNDIQKPEDWLSSSQDKLKHQYLQRYFSRHCSSHNFKQLSSSRINQLIELIVKQGERVSQMEQLNKSVFDNVIKELTTIEFHENSQTAIAILMSLFLTVIRNNKPQICSSQKLSEVLRSMLPPSKSSSTYSLSFNHNENSAKSPNQSITKTFLILYPSIQLKLKNLNQTLIKLYSNDLESELKYLTKIIQGVAYRRDLAKPIKIQYEWMHCSKIGLKTADESACQQCFKKILKLAQKFWNLQLGKIVQSELFPSSKPLTLHLKAQLFSYIESVFPQLLSTKLTQNQEDQSILNVQVTQNTSPISLQIQFLNWESFLQFINDLCLQIGIEKPIFNKKDDQKLVLILNKLLKIVCRISSNKTPIPTIEKFVTSILSNPYNIVPTFILNIVSTLKSTHFLSPSQISKTKSFLNFNEQ